MFNHSYKPDAFKNSALYDQVNTKYFFQRGHGGWCIAFSPENSGDAVPSQRSIEVHEMTQSALEKLNIQARRKLLKELFIGSKKITVRTTGKGKIRPQDIERSISEQDDFTLEHDGAHWFIEIHKKEGPTERVKLHSNNITQVLLERIRIEQRRTLLREILLSEGIACEPLSEKKFPTETEMQSAAFGITSLKMAKPDRFEDLFRQIKQYLAQDDPDDIPDNLQRRFPNWERQHFERLMRNIPEVVDQICERMPKE